MNDNGDGTYTAVVTAPTTSGSGVFAATIGGAARPRRSPSTSSPGPHQIALHAGDAQSAVAGTAVATSPSVIVKDAHGNPVSGVGVAFSVTPAAAR